MELADDCEQRLHSTFFALQHRISLLYTCLYLLFLDTSGIFDVYNAVCPLNQVFIACFKTSWYKQIRYSSRAVPQYLRVIVIRASDCRIVVRLFA